MRSYVEPAATEYSVKESNRLLRELVAHQQAFQAQQELAAAREQRIFKVAVWTLVATCLGVAVGLVALFA